MSEKKPDSATEAFEQALSRPAEGERYTLRLFVTGMTPRSAAALSTLREVCEKHLKGRYDLEVIDIYQHPELAEREQIIAAPTLVKALPKPLRRLIGDLSNMERVLVGLGLSVHKEPGA